MIQPKKWSVPLGSGADVQELPDDDLRYASFLKIFPQITQVPLPAGGVAPRRVDFNSLFKLLADNIYFYQNGGVFEYSDTADYEKGAFVKYNNNLYLCIQDNSALNLHNPDDMDYWLRVALNNELADYLPLAGGNVTGNLTVKNKNVVRTINDVEADVNGNVVVESGTSFLTGQLIQSIVPLNDAMLHLADGALLNGDGVYAEFVAFMAQKVASTPNLFCTEEEWQASNTNYGFCNKFVYDSINNTIRLPKVNSEHGALIKSYSNGADWYRIYQDGWCEQGGFRDGVGDGTTKTQTLLVTMIDNNYSILLSRYYNSSSAVTVSGSVTALNSSVKTTTDFKFIGYSSGNYWQVCGYANISDLQTAPIYEYVVLGTVTKTDIQIDIDNVLSDLANKADKNFSNVTAPTQAFKNMSVGWCMPDWSKVIDITTSKNSYTAPIDGWVFGVLGFTDSYCNAYINGYNIGRKSNDYISMQSPLNAGDVFTSNANAGILYFLPCKGVN